MRCICRAVSLRKSAGRGPASTSSLSQSSSKLNPTFLPAPTISWVQSLRASSFSAASTAKACSMGMVVPAPAFPSSGRGGGAVTKR